MHMISFLYNVVPSSSSGSWSSTETVRELKSGSKGEFFLFTWFSLVLHTSIVVWLRITQCRFWEPRFRLFVSQRCIIFSFRMRKKSRVAWSGLLLNSKGLKPLIPSHEDLIISTDWLYPFGLQILCRQGARTSSAPDQFKHLNDSMSYKIRCINVPTYLGVLWRYFCRRLYPVTMRRP